MLALQQPGRCPAKHWQTVIRQRASDMSENAGCLEVVSHRTVFWIAEALPKLLPVPRLLLSMKTARILFTHLPPELSCSSIRSEATLACRAVSGIQAHLAIVFQVSKTFSGRCSSPSWCP